MSPPRLFFAVACLLLSAAAARARPVYPQWVVWTFDFTPGAALLQADGNPLAGVTFSDEPTKFAVGTSDVFAALLRTVSAAPGYAGDPPAFDTLTGDSGAYSLSLALAASDGNSEYSAELRFTGRLSGPFSSGYANLANEPYPDWQQVAILGPYRFDVTLFDLWPPDQPEIGNLAAHVSVSWQDYPWNHHGDDPELAPLPEPATLVSSLLGLVCCLGGAAWRRATTGRRGARRPRSLGLPCRSRSPDGHRVKRAAGPLALALALALGGAGRARADFITLERPYATVTFVTGISGGRAVGHFYSGPLAQGIVFEGGSYRTLNHPSATGGTFAWGISGGVIVGTYYDGAGAHGFVYDGQSYRTLDHPSGGDVYLTGVSGGTSFGYHFGPTGYQGFVYDGTIFTTPHYPGATGTFPVGISGGVLAGYYEYGGERHGFTYDGTTWLTLDHPDAPGRTTALGVGGGFVVGFYDQGSTRHGFLYDGSSFVTLDHPRATDGTYVTGVDEGTVVGYYQEGSRMRGFLYTAPEPSSFALFGLGAASLACSLTRRRGGAAVTGRRPRRPSK